MEDKPQDSLFTFDGDDITDGEMKLTKSQLEETIARDAFVTVIQRRFNEASYERKPYEDAWVRALDAYNGNYSPEEEAKLRKARDRNPALPKVFIKVTKTKANAAYSQILDILFSTAKFPISISPTPVPEGVPESAYIIDKETNKLIDTASNADADIDMTGMDVLGFAGDGQEIAPGTTTKDMLGGAFDKFKKFVSKDKVIVEGDSPDENQFPEISPAKESANKLEKLIHDQLEENNAKYALRRVAWENVVLGTGCLKGVCTKRDTVYKYKQNAVNKEIDIIPEERLVPDIKDVTIFDAYPDPFVDKADSMDYFIQRHRLNATQLRDLRKFGHFNEDALSRILKNPPAYNKESWEDSIRRVNENGQKFELLEYWGWVDIELLTNLEVDFEDEDIVLEQVQVNAWIGGGELLKAVVNPFIPARIPYMLIPYEENNFEIWGTGVPENMADTQAIMNGHFRLAIENLSLAGSVIFEVNENQLAPGQDFRMYPGKVIRKQGGAPGQSIHTIKFKDTSQSNIAMYDKARQLTDEAVGIPSFAHGQTGVTGVGRTAAGISMLMGAAAGSIKTVVRNFDDYLLEPLGQSLFRWNMQFNSSKVTIVGDYNVVARGTESLLQREVMSQRLISFLQITANPLLMPWVNIGNVIKQLAKSMDLNEDEFINDADTAKLAAEIIQKAQQGVQANGVNIQQGGGAEPQAATQGGGGQSPQGAGSDIQSTTGQGVPDGGINAGVVRTPGEESFTG